MRLVATSVVFLNFSAQTGARAATTAELARCVALDSAVPPVTHPPQVNPTIANAMAPPTTEMFLTLSQDLRIVWHDQRTDIRLKKRIIRTLIEEVRSYAKAQGFDLVLADGVLYANTNLDITPAVLANLKSRAPAPAGR